MNAVATTTSDRDQRAFLVPVLMPEYTDEESSRRDQLLQEAEAADKAQLPGQQTMAKLDVWALETRAWHRTNPDAFRWISAEENKIWQCWLPVQVNLYRDGGHLRLPAGILTCLASWKNLFTHIEVRWDPDTREHQIVGIFYDESALLRRWHPEDKWLRTFDDVKLLLEYRERLAQMRKDATESAHTRFWLGIFIGIASGVSALAAQVIWNITSDGRAVIFAFVLGAVIASVVSNSWKWFCNRAALQREEQFYEAFTSAHPGVLEEN